MRSARDHCHRHKVPASRPHAVADAEIGEFGNWLLGALLMDRGFRYGAENFFGADLAR